MTFRCGTVGRKLVQAMSRPNDHDFFRAGGLRHRAGGISARQPARFPRRCACLDSSERGRAVLTSEDGSTAFRTRLRARRQQGRPPEVSVSGASSFRQRRLAASSAAPAARSDRRRCYRVRVGVDVAHPNVAVHIGVILHQSNNAIPRPSVNCVHGPGRHRS